MSEKHLLLGFYAVTPLHPGSGTELSVIDLPIQRERHTGFPVIWGQSLKGVLRSEFREYELDMTERNGMKLQEVIKTELSEIEAALKRNPTEEEAKKLKARREELEELLLSPPTTTVIFGPPTKRASEHAGAMSVGDAKILLFPVRSLKGVFAYVTSPLVLRRFMEDLRLVAGGDEVKIDKKEKDDTPEIIELSELEKILGEIEKKLPPSEEEEPAKAIVFSDVLTIDGCVILEELMLSAEGSEKTTSVGEDVSKLPEILSSLFPELLSEDKFKERLIMVPDDVFTSLVELTTEVVARVRINAETGTVEKGGLWYEEFLPRDTVMYSLMVVNEPRVNRDKLPAELGDEPVKKIAEILEDVFNDSYLQIGGDETVGKGFTKVSAVRLEGVKRDEPQNP